MTIKSLNLMTILITSISLSGCIQHPHLAPELRPKHWAQLVNKEQNLYQVSPWLYRSEQPINNQKNQLNQLGISTIISLRSRNKSQEQLGNLGFNVIHIPIHTWAINRQQVVDTMKALKQAQLAQEKVLIHCYHGSDRTGTMIAMYRIFFEKWSVEDAKNEMKLGGYGFHPIWVNIDLLFSPENIKWIETQLNPS